MMETLIISCQLVLVVPVFEIVALPDSPFVDGIVDLCALTRWKAIY